MVSNVTAANHSTQKEITGEKIPNETQNSSLARNSPILAVDTNCWVYHTVPLNKYKELPITIRTQSYVASCQPVHDPLMDGTLQKLVVLSRRLRYKMAVLSSD